MIPGMFSVGTDICAISRIEALLKKDSERLLSRVLTPVERAERQNWTPAAVARRWAAKEAIAKALGQGIGATVGFQAIVVTHNAKGAPQVQILGALAVAKVNVSVSDDAGMAIAFAVAENL